MAPMDASKPLIECQIGEMPSWLWLIDANLQMHRPTLLPKGSAI